MSEARKAIGIRREDKNRWERRSPVTPEHTRAIVEGHGIDVVVQPSPIRVFTDDEYRAAGATVAEDLSRCDVVLGIKEMPSGFFRADGTYVFFSHTIKAQKYNMPMLARLAALGCRLIDYEKITDRDGRRLIFFGRHAGMAGMIDSLWALGRRLRHEGVPNPFERIEAAHRYRSIEDARSVIAEAGLDIADGALPAGLRPFICGFTGYGNVSQGAQEIFDLLPVETIRPDEVLGLAREGGGAGNVLYKAVFREEDMAAPADPKERFQLRDYYDHPARYASAFERYVPHLTVLMNCIYWDNRYPRLVTKESLRQLWRREGRPRLRVIGDVSCDVEGAVEATLKVTTPDDPVFVYDPEKDRAIDGWEGSGPVVLAVDNLPCELPREASQYFSDALARFIPALAREDYAAPFERCTLPDEIRKAVILWKGALTPDFLYLAGPMSGE